VPLAGGCHGPRGFLAGPSSLVFVYMLVRQTLRADLVDSLDDLRTTILACLYVTYAYIGCEITYPLKVRSKCRLHATGTARVVCNGRVSVRLSVCPIVRPQQQRRRVHWARWGPGPICDLLGGASHA